VSLIYLLGLADYPKGFAKQAATLYAELILILMHFQHIATTFLVHELSVEILEIMKSGSL
jgi:cellobiose-specific phosphotransferase system component IIA